ncbi:methionine adenosyltransferase 2 subunit beta [Dermacentor silvarum]|uniref:methionine adenosyltransferase 2 subunit beta n=1 Tax=Dermacentor silvarum TaxID=543639 RepID=UPI001897FF07|nr:methionine adenosyltransferase 2 subunit beta [Dermacentor silvarum]
MNTVLITGASADGKIVKEKKPHVIVHSAAQRFPDKVEKDYDASYALNVTASKNLAALADAVGAAFIFISTDYVFDGRDPPYSESAKPNPLNKYGTTKAEAERAVLSAKPDAIVLRVPVLYGGEEYVAESAVSVLCQLLNDRTKHVKVSDYEIRYPSHTEDIAFIVVQLAERRLKDRSVSGVYQWCGLEPLTKYAMVRAIGQAHGLSTDHVSPDAEPSSGAPRPRDCRLEHSRLQQLGIARHTPFAQGVAGFARFLQPAAGQQP